MDGGTATDLKEGDRVAVITMGGARGEVISTWTGKAGAWAWLTLDGRELPFTVLVRDLQRLP